MTGLINMRSKTNALFWMGGMLLASWGWTSSAYAFANVPWILNGNAANSVPGRVMLTPKAPAQAGSMWDPCEISLNTSFDMSFVMNWGSDQCGADGIDFVLQNQGTNALGNDSGEHGYSGIGSSLAVAFDTYSNPGAPYNDPAFDSINLNADGGTADIGSSACGTDTGYTTGTCGRPAISNTYPNIKDGLDHTVRFTWNAATRTLDVYVDGNQRASWTFPATFINDLFGGNPNVYYGFTGSTGGATNYQQVAQTTAYTDPCGYTPVPTPAATATTIPLPTISCGTPIPTFTPAGPTNTFTITQTPTITPTPYPPGCRTAGASRTPA